MATPSVTRDSRTVGIQSPAWKLLAWLVFFITLFSSIGFNVLVFTNLPFYKSEEVVSGYPLVIDLLLNIITGFGLLLTTGVGVIILNRSANWQMGGLLIVLGGIVSLYWLSQHYANYAFRIRPEATLPLKWPAAWFQHWASIIWFYLFLVAFPMLFPSGRPPSARWRVVYRFSLACLALFTVLAAFGEEPLGAALDDLGFMNPYGFIPFALIEYSATGEMIAFGVFVSVFFTFTLLAITCLILRYRRSRGQERQQFKWISYALSIWAVGLWIEAFGFVIDSRLLVEIGWIAWHISILGLPLAIGFAILKYRLYDIDRIINRTLVYGALTGALALVYFGSVVLMQQIFPTDSPIAIVLSTLAVAALFSPLRRRIQEAIDRRFYRRKYDAEQILAAFSARMRNEVELEQISEKILSVVNETLQPTTASLWLREAATSPPDRG